MSRLSKLLAGECLAFVIMSAVTACSAPASADTADSRAEGLSVSPPAPVEHDANSAMAPAARRMTSDEIASLQAAHPELVQPVEALRQSFENAYSALTQGAGTQLEQQRLLLTALSAASSLPPDERSAAQSQIVAFAKSSSSVQ